MIDKKINTISWLKLYGLEAPAIEIVVWLFEEKIKDQIWYSINKPDNIANKPIKALALYSKAFIQLILNIEKYLDKRC